MRSRRAPRAYTQISKLLKCEDLCTKCSKISHISSDFWYCEFLYFAGSSREFLQARKYLTNLRLFVKKICVRSRRAPRVYTYKSKLQNRTNLCLKLPKYIDTVQNCVIFEMCVVLAPAENSRS